MCLIGVLCFLLGREGVDELDAVRIDSFLSSQEGVADLLILRFFPRSFITVSFELGGLKEGTTTETRFLVTLFVVESASSSIE